MVLLNEISEGIWGLPLGPNGKIDVVIQHPIRLTMAALEIDETNSINGITRVTLKSNTANNGAATDLILCNLHYPSCLQQPLDIELYDGQTLNFGVRGPRKINFVLTFDKEEKANGFFSIGDFRSSSHHGLSSSVRTCRR
jgi:hypothetical protein